MNESASRLTLAVPLLAVAAGVAVACTALFLWPSTSSAIPAPGSEVGTRLDGRLPSDIAHLPLVDRNGRPTD
ncbi:MAG: hypothetical protein ACRDSS_07655, partial [Actinocrinis sp.]